MEKQERSIYRLYIVLLCSVLFIVLSTKAESRYVVAATKQETETMQDEKSDGMYEEEKQAEEDIKGKETGSIQIQYPIVGAEFQLFLVGSVDDQGSLCLTGEFAGDVVDLDDDASAETLARYVATEKRSPLQTAKVDDEKQVQFSDLKRGLYLITGKSVKEKGKIYTPLSFLAVLPFGTDEVWDLEVEGKCEEKPEEISTTEETPEEPPQTPPEKRKPRLPQTGSAWLFVWIFFVGGMILLYKGLQKHKR